MKRKAWEEERRKYQEAQAKLVAARKNAEARKREAAQEAKLALRRSAIEERSKRWQEKHARFAKERAAGEAEYRRLIERHQKLLHEKLYEEFAKVVYKPERVYAGGYLIATLSCCVSKDAQKRESLKRRMYNERLGRFKTLRPKEIIDEGALTKFRVEVGALSQTENRSKSTPCQRGRNLQKQGSGSRSQSTSHQRRTSACSSGNGVKSSNPPGECALSSKGTEILDGQPQEEKELKRMLKEQSQEEARLKAPPKVVEDENS